MAAGVQAATGELGLVVQLIETQGVGPGAIGDVVIQTISAAVAGAAFERGVD
ncbi:hypothetical protein D3C81_2283360 [compost metagenome]